MLAGCKRSMTPAKIHAMGIIRRMTEYSSSRTSSKYNRTPLYRHVDDITNLFISNSQAAATEDIIQYTTTLAAELAEYGLTVLA